MDHAGVRAAQRELYEAGEYDALSAVLRPAAEDLVAAASVSAGQRVLDVGTGDGNVAVAAAARGGRPVGVDLSAVQAARARARCPQAVFAAADAERLPFADDGFDAVLSCFAAVFAPNPPRATAELFRVVRPGGTVALTSWPDDGLMGLITVTLREAAPDPGHFPDQDLGWGDTTALRDRLARHGRDVQVERRTLLIDPVQRQAAGERDFAARYLTAHPPTRDLEALHGELLGRFTAPDGRLRFDYLVGVARR